MESHKCLSQKNGERACGCEWVTAHSTLSPGQVGQSTFMPDADWHQSWASFWNLSLSDGTRLQCGHHYKTTRSFTRTKGGAALCGWDYRSIQATPPTVGGWWGTEEQVGGPGIVGWQLWVPACCVLPSKHKSASMTPRVWHSGSSPQRSVGDARYELLLVRDCAQFILFS